MPARRLVMSNEYVYIPYGKEEDILGKTVKSVEAMELYEDDVYKDMEYLKKLYPQKSRYINTLVEDECDKLEYEGSLMFAEYVDKESVIAIAGGIYKKVTGDNKCISMNCTCNKNGNGMRRPPYVPECCEPYDDWLFQLVEVLLYSEIYCRRNRYKRRKKRF